MTTCPGFSSGMSWSLFKSQLYQKDGLKKTMSWRMKILCLYASLFVVAALMAIVAFPLDLPYIRESVLKLTTLGTCLVVTVLTFWRSLPIGITLLSHGMGLIALSFWIGIWSVVRDFPPLAAHLAIYPPGALGIVFIFRVFSRFLPLLMEQAHLDSLTGLYNRHYLWTKLREYARKKQNVCLVLLDLDGLKGVNDHYGHQMGDDVLKRLASLLRQEIRTKDLAFRYGGDEFIVIFPDTTLKDTQAIIERLRKRVDEDPFLSPLEVSFSYGTSNLREVRNPEEALTAADKNMYEEKKAKQAIRAL